jgi:magnesium transporter
MSFEDLKTTFEALLQKGDKLEMRRFLDDQSIIDIANLVYEYEEHEAAIIAGMSIHRAAGVFKILEFPTQQRIIKTLAPSKTAELLNELPPMTVPIFWKNCRLP